MYYNFFLYCIKVYATHSPPHKLDLNESPSVASAMYRQLSCSVLYLYMYLQNDQIGVLHYPTYMYKT